MKTVTAESLNAAWNKYCVLFGESPHGTVTQFRAMLEFIHDEETMSISLETARLINNAFLPLNPNKLRNADPAVKTAAVSFRSELDRKLAMKVRNGE